MHVFMQHDFNMAAQHDAGMLTR